MQYTIISTGLRRTIGRRRPFISLSPATHNNGNNNFHHTQTRRFSTEHNVNTNNTSTDNTSIRHQRPIYVAATKQHVGKTSVSLALIAHFCNRYGKQNVGYMKAVGQQCLRVWDESRTTSDGLSDGLDSEEGQYVIIDKDVK